MPRGLHIICAIPPLPADSGWAIDTFERIKALHSMDVQIHLHYFGCNETGMANELNQYCQSINRYHKQRCAEGDQYLPAMISSRNNEILIQRLNQDSLPVLVEGIQCTGILPYLNSDKKVVVRLQPAEKFCCQTVTELPAGILGKFFGRKESKKVEEHVTRLPTPPIYACVSEEEKKCLLEKISRLQIHHLPAFSGWQKVNGVDGQGNFCLFHGNLSTPENETAATWLINNVFTKARVPLIIAGKNPSKKLEKLSQLCEHTCLIPDPSKEEMDDLVQKAQINVLPCFNVAAAGCRLKLLHALYEGRHCLVNDQMVAGSHLQDACYIANSANDFASVILQLFHLPFTAEEKILRRELLGNTYNNEKNARMLSQWLW